MNFTLPPALTSQHLLYSGIIRLRPVALTSSLQPNSGNSTTNTSNSTQSSSYDVNNQTSTGSSSKSNITSVLSSNIADNNTIHAWSGSSNESSNSSSTDVISNHSTTAEKMTLPPGHSTRSNTSAPAKNSSTLSVTALRSAKQRQQKQLLDQPQKQQTVFFAAASAAPAVGIPYQGYSQYWSRLRVPAEVNFSINAWLAETLKNKQNSLCYAPYSKPVFVNSIMDSQAEVPGVCTGGFSNNDSAAPLNVSLSVLKASPECSLRVTLVPEVPARM